MAGEAAGDGDHAEAEFGKQGDGDAADAAGGAGDENRMLCGGCQSTVLQGHDAEHRGESGGADAHGIAVAQSFGKRNEPVGAHALILAIATPVEFAEAPTGQHHAVAGSVGFVLGFHDLSGHVDTGNHGPVAYHGARAGDGQTVFVVQGGIGDLDQDIPVRQVATAEVLQRVPGLAVFVAMEDQSAEVVGGHGFHPGAAV